MNEDKKQLGFMQEYNQRLETELANERTKRTRQETEMIEQSGFPPINNQNLVEYQLDLKEEIDRLYHLLSGHQLMTNEEGDERWEEPKDDRLKVFSEYGVKQIINLISFYINRNTLLSHYDMETINWKMRDFANELNDLIMNKYEFFFYFPSPEDLFEKLSPSVVRLGLEIAPKELYWKCVQWSKEELQSKIRHYPSIVLSITDSIHSTYLRALKGETLKSLRTMTSISQNTPITQSSNMMPERRTSILRPSTWGKA